MKISIAKLRCIITEAMKTPGDGEDLALFVRHRSDAYELVLYRPIGMKAQIIKSPRSSRVADHVVASMEAYHNEISGYYEVGAVAAMPGWGPFIYDKTIALTGGLVPDRMTVSPAAKKIWAYYHDRRSDVVKVPVTDGRMHNDPILDHAYTLDNDGPATSQMEARHVQFMDDPELAKFIERSHLERLLISAGDRFFVEHKQRLGK